MRYKRQQLMGQIGDEGIEKLNQATVVVVGSGGLGSPVLTYLACAGIGKLVIVDCDVVNESNLNRQFLYGDQDIEKEKIPLALKRLKELNSTIQYVGIQERLTDKNVDGIIENADVVVDCVDNIATRILVGRACLAQNIPLVEAGVQGFYGWVISIGRKTACLECMGYENAVMNPPIPIIGTTAGVIGSLQANECIKIILGMKETLFGRMLQYDGLDNSLECIEVKKQENCKAHQIFTEE